MRTLFDATMSIVETILEWYSRQGRSFVWREHTPPAYTVLISETMLQQTQTSRVVEKLPRFLAVFPDIKALAAATNAEIIKAWQGLGYNSRALRLRDCAKAVVEKHGGYIPDTYDELRSLPGVGDYTASALLAFAFRKDVLVLDVNTKRVLSRIYGGIMTNIDLIEEDTLRQFGTSLVPTGKSSEWHQALMDIGALYCTARSPKCSACPIGDRCPSAGLIEDVARPKKKEPMHRNIPSRIWRGKLVEQLRRLPKDDFITLEELENSLFRQPTIEISSSDDSQWLATTAERLVRDRIVEYAASPKPAIRLVQDIV